MRHGTLSGYIQHGCRCVECRAAKAAYQRARGENVRVGARAEQKRRWDRENVKTCACGAPMARKADRCEACRRKADAERVGERREFIAYQWAAGTTVTEIARRLGTTKGTIGVEMARMRAAGWDLPHRAAVRGGRRVAA